MISGSLGQYHKSYKSSFNGSVKSKPTNEKSGFFLLTFSMFVLGAYLQMFAINEPTQLVVQIASSKQKFRSQPDRGTGPVGSRVSRGGVR